MKTPDSPFELFAMNDYKGEGPEDTDRRDPWHFANVLTSEILPELEPEPYQVVKACEAMLLALETLHVETLDANKDKFDAMQKKLWGDDLRRLTTAVEALRAMNPD